MLSVVLHIMCAEFDDAAYDYRARMESYRFQLNIAREMSARGFEYGLHNAIRLHLKIAREHLMAARSIRLGADL